VKNASLEVALHAYIYVLPWNESCGSAATKPETLSGQESRNK